jgi:pimeloyl-ACP methyl ester carboxylesterase
MTALGPQRIDIPYKNYGFAKFSLYTNNNSKIIILLPGQTLPAEMFLGLPVFDNGDSVIDKLLVNGYDVGCLDPVMYGNSQGHIPDLYTRQQVADQLILAITSIENDYAKIFLQGYSTTSPVPFIASSKKNVDGILSLSPVLPTKLDSYTKQFLQDRNVNDLKMSTNVDLLRTNRFKINRESMPGHSKLVDNWEEIFLTNLSTFENFTTRGSWSGPKDIVMDIAVYYTMNNDHGWTMSNVTCPVVVVKGSHDFECSDKPPYENMFSNFIDCVKPNLKETIIVDSASHFGMWEECHADWTSKFITALDLMS